MGYPGLEPGTNRLKAEYSTIELATLNTKYLLILSFFIKFFNLTGGGGGKKLPFLPYKTGCKKKKLNFQPSSPQGQGVGGEDTSF